MMARWLCSLTILALSFSSGCCCFELRALRSLRRPHLLLPLARPCVVSIPSPGMAAAMMRPLPRAKAAVPAADAARTACWPTAAVSRLLAWLGGCLARAGCGEIYCDEWKSDPPDCCDPCDQCYGEFTGPHGYCCLGPCQRLLACLDGYKYCSPPVSGPWRPIFGHCSPCPAPSAGPPGSPLVPAAVRPAAQCSTTAMSMRCRGRCQRREPRLLHAAMRRPA